MRILLVNVNTTAAATADMVAAASAQAAPGTEVVGLTPAYGSAGVDSNAQSLLAAVGVMDAVRRYADPYDAIVVGGFGEHGREGLQELVDVPVLDIAECAAHVAMMLGRTFSVVTTLQRSVAQVEDRLLLAGLSARCASVRAIGLATRQLDDAAGPATDAADPDAALALVNRGGGATAAGQPLSCPPGPGSADTGAEDPDPAISPATLTSLATSASPATAAIIEAARRAVTEDHAEVVVLGCGGMAGLDAVVSAAVGVPVVDGVTAAVAIAESLVGLGLRTSSTGSCAPADLSATTWPVAPGGPDV